MEITEHERVLLVNSLIQTISELYEHDGERPRRTRSAACPHDGGLPGTRATHAGSRMRRSARQVPEMTAYVRTPHYSPCATSSAVRRRTFRARPGRSAAAG